jgi:hypothetical protein
MFIDAVREFRDAYRKLNKAPVRASTLELVRDDYRDNIVQQRARLIRQSAKPHEFTFLMTEAGKTDIGKIRSGRHRWA